MKIDYHIITYGTCETLEDIPKGAEIESIDGRDFVAFCESCRKPILSENTFKGIPADKYQCDDEGVYLCESCVVEMMMHEENQTRYVTHEMALDSGDPSLEGTEY